MRTILSVFLFSFIVTCHAATLNSGNDTRKLSDQLMQYFIKADFDQGLGMAKKYWPLPPVEIDNLANQIKTQWSVVDQRFGQPTGYEFITRKTIGKSFIKYYYLHKFQHHAIYWTISFYKPQKQWVINSIVFSDELAPLFVSD